MNLCKIHQKIHEKYKEVINKSLLNPCKASRPFPLLPAPFPWLSIFRAKLNDMIPGSKGQKIRCKLACKRIFELGIHKNTEKQPFSQKNKRI